VDLSVKFFEEKETRPDPRSECDRQQRLLQAVVEGSIEKVKLSLKDGARADFQSAKDDVLDRPGVGGDGENYRHYLSPLDLAIVQGKFAIVELLISTVAPFPNLVTRSTFYENCLYLTALQGSCEMARVVLRGLERFSRPVSTFFPINYEFGVSMSLFFLDACSFGQSQLFPLIIQCLAEFPPEGITLEPARRYLLYAYSHKCMPILRSILVWYPYVGKVTTNGYRHCHHAHLPFRRPAAGGCPVWKAGSSAILAAGIEPLPCCNGPIVPHSLQQSCLIKIRSCLQLPLSGSVAKLPLPLKVKDILMFRYRLACDES